MDRDSRSIAWDRAADRVAARPYLDPLVAAAKRRAHLELLDRWLPSLAGKSLLKTDLWEEGVAGDELLFTLAREARAHAIDVSPVIVARTRQRAAELGLELEAVSGDLRQAPYPDGQFDVILSTSTIDHLDGAGEQRRALAELRRLLAPGGTLIVTVDNPDNATDWLLRLAGRAGLIPFPLADAPSLEELQTHLVATGFRPQRHEYLVPAPRVVATALVRLARLLPEDVSDRTVARELRLFEALGRRAPRRLGSFVAVLATPS